MVLKLSKQADSGVDLPQIADVSPRHWAARSIATGAEANGSAGNNAAAGGKPAAAQARAMGLDNMVKNRVTTAAAAPKPMAWWQQSGVKRTKVKVDMPTGVAAIRGTFWQNQVAPDGSFTTTLLNGEATVTSSNGQNVSLTAGQRTEVPTAGAPPAPPAPLTAADQQAWVQVAAWAQQQAYLILQNQEQSLPPPPPADLPTQTTPPAAPQPGTPAPPPPPNITQIIYTALTNAGATNLAPPNTPVPPPAPAPAPVLNNNNNSGGSSSAIVIPVSHLTLDSSQIALMAGGEPYVLTPLIAPSDATNKTVTWASSNPAVATVVNGIVVPIAYGQATITATTADGNNQASCQVYVEGMY